MTEDGNSAKRLPGYWQFASHIGMFRLVPKGGRLHLLWDGETVGIYLTGARALADISDGKHFSAKYGLDSSWARVPETLYDWTFVLVEPR